MPEGYRRFGRASDLAAAIALEDPEALAFASSNPMGMGLSWYVPERLLTLLEGWRVYRIRQEWADQDFEHFVADYRRHLGLRLGGLLQLRSLLQPKRARPLTRR
ncbi:MAG: hypothetical protein VKI83_11950, partial [Synechococcaceae cyanobacterium]|nr:hypothetical protein [Synechococcaceae cyanobacterium]